MRQLITILLVPFALTACGDKGTDSSGEETEEVYHTCAEYCTEYMANCTDANNEYKDNADCTTQCGAWTQGEDGDTSGNTLECRYYHAGAAATDAATHCPHAGPTGGGVCI